MALPRPAWGPAWPKENRHDRPADGTVPAGLVLSMFDPSTWAAATQPGFSHASIYPSGFCLALTGILALRPGPLTALLPA